jgi:hypothetical protein
MWSEKAKETVKYWEEKHRILYNAVLTLVAVAWVVGTWPHFRNALTFEHALALIVLALLANLCYCAAYLVEFPAGQVSANWAKRRWMLWLAGMILAFVLENYWIADEIYPDAQ